MKSPATPQDGDGRKPVPRKRWSPPRGPRPPGSRRPGGSGWLQPRAINRAQCIVGEAPGASPVRRRDWIVLPTLLVADAIGVAGAFVWHDLVFGPSTGHWAHEPLLLGAAILLTTIGAKVDGLYSRDAADADHTTADELVAIFRTVTVVTWVLVAAALVSRASLGDPPGVVELWATAIVLIPAARTVARAIGRRRHSYVQRTVIVGAGVVGQMLAEKIIRNGHMGMRLVGFVDGSPRNLADSVAHIPVLGGLDQLQPVVRENGVERVVVAFSDDSLGKTLDIIRALSSERVHIDIVPRLFEAVGPAVRMHSIEGIPLVGLPSRQRAPVSRLVKRGFDLLFGTLLLVTSVPLLAVVALCIKLDSPGPVFYRSERIGKNGRRFNLRKFRTMRFEACRGVRYGSAGAEKRFQELLQHDSIRDEFKRTRKLRNDPRVTRIGAWLRKTSLDELPQLLNVVLGDLSIVGPRPITVEEFDQFFASGTGSAQASAAGPRSPSGAERLPGYWVLGWVLPGITGYWQITGRSSVGYEERLRLDWTYAASWSLKLDLLILAKTLRALGGRDAS